MSARKKSAPKRAPRVPFALLVTGLVVGGLALLLALNTASAANELRRHELATQDAAVSARVQELQIEVAASAAPANLASVATELGMVPARHPAFLVVGADGKVRLMGRPRAVSAAPVPIPPAPHRKKKPATSSATRTAVPSKPAGTLRSTTSSSPAPTRSASPRPTASRSSAKHSPAAALPAAPTPLPTPVVTLPGGAR